VLSFIVTHRSLTRHTFRKCENRRGCNHQAIQVAASFCEVTIMHHFAAPVTLSAHPAARRNQA
jgi:hypothetical protein